MLKHCYHHLLDCRGIGIVVGLKSMMAGNESM